ncbi:hypothetical protein, partial [Rubrivivax gelatinosus]
MSRRRRPDEDTLPLFGEADWPAAEPAPQPPAPADDDSGWSPALPAEALPDLDVFFDEDGTLPVGCAVGR